MASPFIIEDNTSPDILFPKDKGRGAVPRDFLAFPPSMGASPAEMHEYPESEWEDRIKENQARKRTLTLIRNKAANGSRMPSLDQGQVGYCWGHSVTHTIMMARAVAMQEYVPLSAYSVCSIIKKGADEGGWCGLAWEFVKKYGVNSQKLWPQGRRDYRTLDTAQAQEERSHFKVIEDWVDLARPYYDKKLTWKQTISRLIDLEPCALDFNWWGHSVCGLEAVIVEPGSIGIRILNSWSDGWGDQGTSILRGSKAIPDGAICTRVVMAA